MSVMSAIAGLYVVILLRAGGTYAAGRLGALAARRTRLRARFGETRIAKAERFVDRWGPGAVVASFFTIGIQTAVNFTAGLLRMPVVVYLPALAVGGLAWATIYGTVGAFTFEAVKTLAATHPVIVVIAMTVIVLAVLALLWRALRPRPLVDEVADPDA